MSSSIPYSACSSFAALSGNSDLQVHSSSKTAVSYPESDERDVEVANENATVELDEEEPIDHLLEVKKVSQYPTLIKILKKFLCHFRRNFARLHAFFSFVNLISILVTACGNCITSFDGSFLKRPIRSNTG